MPTPSRRPRSVQGWPDKRITAIAIAGIVVLAFTGRLLLTGGAFNVDLVNSYWLGTIQEQANRHSLFPTYFTNTTSDGVFNPFFAFYGGSLYAVEGWLGWLLGGSLIAAQSLLLLVAVSLAYGGLYWLSRQGGISRMGSHVAPLVYLTSAYYVTVLYARGDWAEFIATSALPVVLAGAVDRVRRGCWTRRAFISFVLGMVILAGSHNITMLWGLSSIAVTLLVLVVFFRGARTMRSMAGAVASVSIVGALATLVNGWYLIPDVAYAGKVAAGTGQSVSTFFFDTWQVLFAPFRAVPSASTTPGLYVQLPIWFLTWALLVGLPLQWRRAGGAARLWRFAVIGTAFEMTLLLAKPVWSHIPAPFDYLQFPYRLSTYAALAISGLSAVTVRLLQDYGSHGRTHTRGAYRRRYSLATASLAAVSVVSIGLMIWQVWWPRPILPGHRDTLSSGSVHVVPKSWYAFLQYADHSDRVIDVAKGRLLKLDPYAVGASGSTLNETLAAPPGLAPFATNVVAGPYLISIGGDVRRIGRTSNGLAVVQRTAPGSGPVRVHIVVANSPGILVGKLASIVAPVALIGLYFGVIGSRQSSFPARPVPSSQRPLTVR